MQYARRMLDRFAETADKTHPAPADSLRFCELSIYIHEHALSITGLEIRDFLFSRGFSADVAFRLGVQFERYRDLLGRCDRFGISTAHASVGVLANVYPPRSTTASVLSANMTFPRLLHQS